MPFEETLNDLKGVIRTKTFMYGLIVRIATISILLWLANMLPDLNDMNEIVNQGLNYITRGINPYGQWYFLKIFNFGPFEGHNQSYFGYGPFMFILYFPTLLCPASIGIADIMPAFVVMNNVYDFLIFYQLHKHQTFQNISWIYWANPLFVLMGFFSFFNSIFFLITMGLVNLEKPKLTALYFTFAAIAYQYVLIFLAFIFVYHKRQLKDFIKGIIPAIIIVGIFFLWGPRVFINDIILMQFRREYISWSSIWARDASIAYACSLPAIVFNLTGGALVVPPSTMLILYSLTGNPCFLISYPFNIQFDFGLKISTYMMAITIVVFGVFLLHNFLKKDRDRTFDYMIITYCAIIVANQTGLYHYWFLLLIPLLFYYKKKDFYSEIGED